MKKISKGNLVLAVSNFIIILVYANLQNGQHTLAKLIFLTLWISLDLYYLFKKK